MYNGNTQTIVAPVEMIDIADALKEDSLDLGTLCDSRAVRGFARWKPIADQNRGSLTDERIQALNYGWSIPAVSVFSSLRQESSKWQRKWPLAGYYRMLDFAGYYADAPDEVLSQCVGETMTFNVMNPFPGQIAFYFFNRSGYLRDREKFDNGLTTLRYGRSDDQLYRCVGLEDLKTDNGYSLYKEGAQLGVIFMSANAGTFDSPLAQVWCEPLAIVESGDDAELVKMYRKELIDVALPSGESLAVFCLRIPTDELSDGGLESLLPTKQSYRYIRVQDVTDYPSMIPVVVSGAEKMQYTIAGLATSYSSSSWVSALNTKGSVAYVKVTVTNKRGITITNTAAFQPRWNAVVKLSGNKVISGTSSAIGINTESRMSIYRWRYTTETTWRDGNTAYISLENNKSVEIIFQINDIWNLGELLSPLSSGMVSVGITPRFDEDSFTYGGGTQLQALTINYA